MAVARSEPTAEGSGALRIAEELALPMDAVTETFVLLAMRGMGKTHLGSVLAEELCEAGQRFCAIDPTGVWYGLKASADGTGPGYPVVIFGGPHADVPLGEDMGHALADLVVDEAMRCILDLSLLRRQQQHRVVADFAETLYLRNRAPIHLLVDEADEFAPQTPHGREQQRALEALDQLVRRGRAYGIGASLLSQRPAVVAKNVLTQAQALIVLRLVAAQDRDAIEAWIRAQADVAQVQEVLGSLASLQRGEAWIWSPGWLRLLQRIRIRPRRTYDSSATPPVGQPVRSTVALRPLAAADLARLQQRLYDALTHSTSEDPAVLHAQIATLHRQLGERGARPPQVERVITVERVEVPAFAAGELEQAVAVAQQMTEMGAQLLAAAERLGEAVTRAVALQNHPDHRDDHHVADIGDGPAAFGAGTAANGAPSTFADHAAPRRRAGRRARADSFSGAPDGGPDHPTPAGRVAATASNVSLSRPQQRILDTLAALAARRLTQVPRHHVAALSGQSPLSSSFGNHLGRLRTLGLVDYPDKGLVALTAAGRARAAADVAPLASREELHQAWYALLKPTRARILRALITRYPQALSRSDLATLTDQSPASSSFGNHLGALRSLGLIEYPRSGEVQADRCLFLEPGGA